MCVSFLVLSCPAGCRAHQYRAQGSRLRHTNVKEGPGQTHTHTHATSYPAASVKGDEGEEEGVGCGSWAV